ncbi:CRISPR-associated protein Cas4 [Candidatus Micrarchaeota archaeon]|nr:CRISPR-associated protein Cas4 [Candidatus Micrarchaeota archaeon]
MGDIDMAITGTQVAYLFICPTKLWYFSHHMQMEQNSDLVATGRFIDKNTYKRERKNIVIEGIAIDFIRTNNGVELHEVKKSPKMEKSHEMQALYYLYTLKKKGINATIVIDYPTIRQRKRLELTESEEKAIGEATERIEAIVSLPKPPSPERKPFCPKCAYYELCWSE